MDVDPNQLREAVESQHGGRAKLVEAVPVEDGFQGEAAWNGVVHVYQLFAEAGGETLIGRRARFTRLRGSWKRAPRAPLLVGVERT